jgi:uncharacterized SAM-binding protein YcdF (DUF218 family)
MFFILSKLLFFLTLPTVWLMGLLLWALRTSNELYRRRLLRTALGLTVLMTNPLFSNAVFNAWEAKPVAMTALKDTFDIGIVLGGFGKFDVHPYKDRLNFNYASNRLSDAMVLYKKGIIRKILISGGDGRITGENVDESMATGNYLKSLGIPDSVIILEGKSRNTFENALFSKQMVDKTNPKASILLITSAFHMRRSEGCFRKAGFKFTSFPAHFVAERLQWDGNSTIEPDDLNFQKWNMFIKEWLGYVVYWIKGYI